MSEMTQGPLTDEELAGWEAEARAPVRVGMHRLLAELRSLRAEKAALTAKVLERAFLGIV